MLTNRQPRALARSRRATVRSRAAGLAVALVCLTAVAGCGADDDSGDAATTAAPSTTDVAATTAVPMTTAVPATTALASAADVDGFCQAEVAVEAATAGEQPDPTAVAAAFDELVATAPDDIKPAVQTAVDEASAFLASGGDSTPAFDAAHEEVLDYVQANCGFTDLSATGSEYAFGGLPDTIPAGPALVTFENIGAEVHMMLFARINDDVTESLEELLALPEEEVVGKVTDVGTAFAEPGSTGRTVVDLQPGRYAVVCFIPEGATPDNMPAIASGELEGAPHAMLGMAQEIEAV
jgi:hypothetical protein